MVGSLNIRAGALLVMAALVSLAFIACDTQQIQYYLKPTIEGPGGSVPGPTVVSATALSQHNVLPAQTQEEPSDSPATELVIGTPAEAHDLDKPETYFVTQSEAVALAEILGCTGWATIRIDGVTYFRACADDEVWDQLQLTSEYWLTLNPDTSGNPFQPTVIPITPGSMPSPQATVTTTANTSPFPQHYYGTVDEAITVASELACPGWTGVTHEGTGYFRPCGSDEEFEIRKNGGPVTLSGTPCNITSDPTARFSALPTDLSQIASIVPTGAPAGGVIKPHSYLHNQNKIDGNNVRVPVYAVADSVLTSVAYYDTIVDTSEYLIFFDVTCEISFKFDHISEVAPKIAAVSPKTASANSATTHTDAISFQAGELIGYTVGAGGFGAWDFGAYDLTYTNQFANQERYEIGHMTQSIHAVCPYDYFEEPLKSQMYALFGTHDQRLLSGIECTTTERDVIGAASGAWFDSLDFQFSESKISIGMLPGDFVTLSGIGSDVRIEKSQPTWLDPSLLTTSHCYVSDRRWFYIEIQVGGMQMALVNGTGNCPNSMPADSIIYYR